ncbi:MULTISPECIES: MarR family winged helix-turn-helix transcriptional regulator [Pseudomonas]|uniref:MarR family winged helix-turn-helix transcriptional regulator n=1 Tax=Pseudomonas TaxID=286 RepID=UPI002499DAFE|nr:MULTISPECIES: MarR family transcriptional regulator [Pseudomonas]
MSRTDACEELKLDNQLCFALYSTSLLMTKIYKPLLQAVGLTYPQYLAMLVLWEGDGITVGDLSARLLTDPGSVTPLLKRLEGIGLITRTRSSSDERVVELHVTEAGWALRKQAEAFPLCIVEASGQSVEELVALKDQLVTLRSHFRNVL